MVRARYNHAPYSQYDPVLCHYTTRYGALAHIVPTQRLRLSPFAQMADPVEAKDAFAPFSYQDPPPPNAEVNALQAGVNRILKHETKLLSFTLDGVGVDDLRAPPSHFHRGYARPRMWEHYAERHSGVCLLYDEHLVERVVDNLQPRGSVLDGRVRYSATPYTGLHESPIDYGRVQRGEETLDDLLAEVGERVPKELFFTKFDDWATEHEYRIVLHSLTSDYEFVDVSGLLKGVVVGHLFPDSELHPLIPLCAEQGAILARVDWEQGHPQFIPIYNPTVPLRFSTDSPTGHLVAPLRDQLEGVHPSEEEWQRARRPMNPSGTPLGPPETFRSRFA